MRMGFPLYSHGSTNSFMEVLPFYFKKKKEMRVIPILLLWVLVYGIRITSAKCPPGYCTSFKYCLECPDTTYTCTNVPNQTCCACSDGCCTVCDIITQTCLPDGSGCKCKAMVIPMVYDGEMDFSRPTL